MPVDTLNCAAPGRRTPILQAHPDAVTALSGGSSASYIYDANGNTLAPGASAGVTCRVENGVTFTQGYNAENRLATVKKLSTGNCAVPGQIATQWDFAYDGDGTRVKQVVSTYDQSTPQNITGIAVTAYFMGGAYEVTTDASNVTLGPKKYYAIAGMTVAMNNGGGLQYLLTDHLGSVVAVTNSSGTLTSQQRYLPFGQVRTDLNGPRITATDFGYTGQRNNSYINLLDYHSRWMDPLLGRFVSPDSIIPDPSNPQSWNRYSYVLNNPIINTDPTGHCIEAGDAPPGSASNHSLCPPRKSGESGGGGDASDRHNGSGSSGNNGQTADLGSFQLLPPGAASLTYSQSAEESYSGWYRSGAPAYGDIILPGMEVNSSQIQLGAAASFPAVLDDWAAMGVPYAQKAWTPYNQKVSLNFSVQYYNVPRTNGYAVATVNGLQITNSDSWKQVVNYTVALSSPSNPNIVRSGIVSAGPNQTVSVSMPANFTFSGMLNVAVHAFTGCTGPCLSSNPPLPSLAGYGNFSFSP